MEQVQFPHSQSTLGDISMEDFLKEFMEPGDILCNAAAQTDFDNITMEDFLKEFMEPGDILSQIVAAESKSLSLPKATIDREDSELGDWNDQLKRKAEACKEAKINAKKLKVDENELLLEEKADLTQLSFPIKLRDPGSFVLRISINGFLINALADSGSNISLMPHSLYSKLGLGQLEEKVEKIKMADQSVRYLKGVGSNILVCIGRFLFKEDFFVLDMIEDQNIPVILGRSFLNTADARINFREKEISIGIREDRMSFIMNDNLQQSYTIDLKCLKINTIDETLDEMQELVVRPGVIVPADRPGEWRIVRDEEEIGQVTPPELGIAVAQMNLEEFAQDIVPTGWGTDNEETEDLIDLGVHRIQRVRNFLQYYEETLDVAWERMKELVADLEEDESIQKNEYLHHFYDGLEEYAMEVLDRASGERFREVSEDLGYQILEEKRYREQLEEMELYLPKKEIVRMKLDEIRAFKQKDEEEISEAWEHFQVMLDELFELSPQDILDDAEILHVFYDGLHFFAKEALDMVAGGYYLSKSASECFEILHTRSYEIEVPDEPLVLYDLMGSPRERDPDELTLKSGLEDEATIKGLQNMLNLQAKAFAKVTDELEKLRDEISEKDRLGMLETQRLENRLEELIRIQKESPLGKFKEGEEASTFDFIPEEYKERRRSVKMGWGEPDTASVREESHDVTN